MQFARERIENGKGWDIRFAIRSLAGEIFKENESALICDAKDAKCFAENILKIFKDKDLAQRMGQSAKNSADNQLNSEKNYFEKYADSINLTAKDFRKSNFILRIFKFKKMMYNLILIAVVAIAIFGLLVAMVKRYKRCPSDKLLVIYGKTGKKEGGEACTARVTHGGGQFVWPIIQDYDFLDLKPIAPSLFLLATDTLASLTALAAASLPRASI
jgi:hypothetical protein